MTAAEPEPLIKEISAGDPIIGVRALHELVALGDAGEEAVFSRPIELASTVQAHRRWLRYIASREETVVSRLLDRLQNQDRFRDALAAAQLFAGITETDEATHALYGLINNDLKDGHYDRVWNQFIAWGYAGGRGTTLWAELSKRDFAWEKLNVVAFGAACAAAARVNAQNNCLAIEELITHKNPSEVIRNSPDAEIPAGAIQSNVLENAVLPNTSKSFSFWRRGEVVDKVLSEWSEHAHWRVRHFGAQVLATLQFARTVNPAIEWLQREPVSKIRNWLLIALACSQTAEGANALVEHFNSHDREGANALVGVAWRAGDKRRALDALTAVAGDKYPSSVEAMVSVVSMARLGRSHPYLSEMLDSVYYYHRLIAALAFAYLGEKNVFHRLATMLRESATRLERVCLAAALAMLGKQNGAKELHKELIAAAQDPKEGFDLFRADHNLQTAVLDALAHGDAQDGELLDAWRAEIEPLDPIPQPVVISTTMKPTSPVKAMTEIAKPTEDSEQGAPPFGGAVEAEGRRGSSHALSRIGGHVPVDEHSEGVPTQSSLAGERGREVNSEGEGMALSPMKVIDAARKAVPAVDFALGVAGLSAAAAIVGSFLGYGRSSVIALGGIFVAMILLFLFGALVSVSGEHSSIHVAGVTLLWAVLLFFCTFLFFTASAVAIRWPPAWAQVLGLQTSEPGPAASPAVSSENSKSLNALIEQLFGVSASQRQDAYHDLINYYSKRPVLVPTIVKYADQHMENQNGIYNTVVLLTNVDLQMLRPESQAIRSFAELVRAQKNPDNFKKTLKLLDKLLQRLQG